MYGHILIATDGSDLARRGVERGLELARDLNLPVTLVTVTDPLPSYSGISPEVLGLAPEILEGWAARQSKIAGGILSEARGRADALGVRADVLHIPDARAAEAILNAAGARGAGLIVMASHGRGGLGRLVLGSQTNEVVTRSPIPVLVVR